MKRKKEGVRGSRSEKVSEKGEEEGMEMGWDLGTESYE